MTLSDLQVAAAKLVLKLCDTDALRLTAGHLVREGYDSASLRRLVDMPTSDPDVVEARLKEALEDSGLSLPTRREAVILVAKELSQQILSGKLGPIDGAQAIWRASIDVDAEYPELSTFLFAALEFEDRQDERPMFEKAILKAAKDLVELPVVSKPK